MNNNNTTNSARNRLTDLNPEDVARKGRMCLKFNEFPVVVCRGTAGTMNTHNNPDLISVGLT